MKIVGHRKEPVITFSASAEKLLEGARFNDELQKLPTGRETFFPKGVYHYKTHQEADQHRLICLSKGMAEIASGR
ncbi:MAG: hypothetical protein ACRD4L_05725 [Pyrinomonadaceae bacterium]